MGVDAEKEEFNLMHLFGNLVLFTTNRIDRGTVPNNMFMYETRGSSQDGHIHMLMHRVIVDFFGTIISKEPLLPTADLDTRSYVDLKDYGFEACGSVTLQQYADSNLH
jgi:hypothetical protein